MSEGRDEKGRFTAGNLFCLGGYNGGRPRIYDNPELMYNAIADYLDFEDQQKGKEGKGVYTLEGCALFLGFASVQSMYDYENKTPEFSDTIKKARSKMEVIYEQLLQDGNSGAIFALKNFGWKDKQEIEQTGDVSITINKTYADNSD